MCFNSIFLLVDISCINQHYLTSIQHLNQVGMHLLRRIFFQWEIIIMCNIREFFDTTKSIIWYNRYIIKRSVPTQLRKAILIPSFRIIFHKVQQPKGNNSTQRNSSALYTSMFWNMLTSVPNPFSGYWWVIINQVFFQVI